MHSRQLKWNPNKLRAKLPSSITGGNGSVHGGEMQLLPANPGLRRAVGRPRQVCEGAGNQKVTEGQNRTLRVTCMAGEHSLKSGTECRWEPVGPAEPVQEETNSPPSSFVQAATWHAPPRTGTERIGHCARGDSTTGRLSMDREAPAPRTAADPTGPSWVRRTSRKPSHLPSPRCSASRPPPCSRGVL